MKRLKKILFFTISFDILFIVVSTIIMYRNKTVNLIENFEIKWLLEFLATFLIPSLILALIGSNIQKQNKNIFKIFI